MKYLVEVNGERVEVDLDATGVRIAGRTVRAHLADVDGTPFHLVSIDDSVQRVAMRRGEGRGRYVLWIGGYRFGVEALDERSHAIRALTAASSAPKGPAPLLAPMPGLVVRVQVRVGDTVQAGQGLIVMEAMKMENELRSATAGRVTGVHVEAGAVVEKGTVLVELE
jgi:acetyl/propionyl-CoA carboxylase alpha subunit